MKLEIGLVLATLLVSAAEAKVFKCPLPGGSIAYSDRACPGGMKMTLDKAPPLPAAQPRRLVIEHQDSAPAYRYDRKLRNRLYAAANRLEQRNRALREQIDRMRSQHEQELANATMGPRRYQQLSAINLYWQGRMSGIETEYDRNLAEIRRLKDMAARRD